MHKKEDHFQMKLY